MRTVFSGGLWLSYAQMYVETGGLADMDDGDADLAAAFAGQRNGLCGAAVPGRLWLITGMHTGTVPFTVEVHDSAPPVEDGWEEVVEASLGQAVVTVDLVRVTDEIAGWADVQLTGLVELTPCLSPVHDGVLDHKRHAAQRLADLHAAQGDARADEPGGGC